VTFRTRLSSFILNDYINICCYKWHSDTFARYNKQKNLRLFPQTPLPDSDSSSSQQHSQTYNVVETLHFDILEKVLATIFFSSLVVVPVGIIFLGDLDKRNRFVVLFVFSLFFASVLCVIEQRFGPYLVGVVAYNAALSAVLTNSFS
jgi:hypothetical protein